MKRSSTAFLQAVLTFVGIGVLAFLLWVPLVEGRNVRATLFEVYFQDPFLAFAYIGSLPFFAALFLGFRLLGYAGQDRVISQKAVQALRTIKFCALAMIGFVAIGEVFILTNSEEDKAGGIAMGLFIAFGSIVLAAAAATFERVLQNAVDLKSENDLTV